MFKLDSPKVTNTKQTKLFYNELEIRVIFVAPFQFGRKVRGHISFGVSFRKQF